MNFRLMVPSIDFWVDVRLRSWRDKWLAVAEIAGEPEIGLGRTAREALEGALGALGTHASAAFLADPALRAVSAEVFGHKPPHGT